MLAYGSYVPFTLYPEGHSKLLVLVDVGQSELDMMHLRRLSTRWYRCTHQTAPSLPWLTMVLTFSSFFRYADIDTLTSSISGM